MGLSQHHGIAGLWRETLGDPRVCIAVIDGPVDLSHRCFDGAALTQLREPVEEAPGLMAAHGTHVASLIFGQPGSPIQGIAPRCRGLLIPVFSERKRKVSQLSLASAICLAVEHGADIINISSGQLTYFGESEDLLAHAIEAARKKNVLVVAAAGNDRDPKRNREECLHTPASLPSVLIVGGMDEDGNPLASNCWAPVYDTDGVLALGKDVLGAIPTGDAVHRFTGTSFAAPIVSGVAALLLSLQLKRGERMSPYAVRSAILKTATPCNSMVVKDCRPHMAGELDGISANQLLLEEAKMSDPRESFIIAQSELEDAGAPSASPGLEPSAAEAPPPAPEARSEMPAYVAAAQAAPMAASVAPSGMASSGVEPSGGCGCSGEGSGLVFFIGLVGYDFGTEARRDTFKQQMPPAWWRQVRDKDGARDEFLYLELEGTDGKDVEKAQKDGYVPVPSNPYDPRQMVAYLRHRPWEAASLIWTLNLELTPVYSVLPIGPYGDAVYETLVEMLAGQSLGTELAGYVERVSVPAVLSGESVRLFSGQEVSQLWVDAPRGMYSWRTTYLLARARPSIVEKLGPPTAGTPAVTVDTIDELMRQVLNKLYYEYRNLGVTSPDRAMNFAATNIFTLTDVLATAFARKKSLDRIDVVKSPYGRVDSDCWDVMLKFLDPENTNRAYSVFRYTLDVSDKLPVTMGPVVSYTSST